MVERSWARVEGPPHLQGLGGRRAREARQEVTQLRGPAAMPSDAAQAAAASAGLVSDETATR